jgi:hypothetical protein
MSSRAVLRGREGVEAINDASLKSKSQSSARGRNATGVCWRDALCESGLSSTEARGASSSSGRGVVGSSSAVMVRIQFRFVLPLRPQAVGGCTAGSERVDALLLGGLSALT